jgi:hypothetical protein
MKSIKGCVIFKVDTKQKWKYNLTDDIQLHIEKNFNFNLREDRCSRGYCINGDKIPFNAEILFHHLGSEPNYEVPYQHEFLTELEIHTGFKIFTVPEDMVFAYRTTEEGEWIPYKQFLITKRIFKAVNSSLSLAKFERVKNKLYVVSGKDEWDGEETDLAGKVMMVTENSDYEIIFHDTKNKPQSVIRTRWRELLAIDESMTKDVKSAKYFVGLGENDCQPLNN